MVKLEQEKRWGAILGVMQTDMDKMRMALRKIVSEISLDMCTIDTRLRADGLVPPADGSYQRYYQLKSLLGGLSVMLDGYDGILSSTIIELLKDAGEELREE